MRLECIHGVDDEADIRLAVFVQWCGDAHHQRIALNCTAKVSGGLKAGFTCSGNFVSRDVFDVAFAGVELVNFFNINVDTNDAIADSVVA